MKTTFKRFVGALSILLLAAVLTLSAFASADGFADTYYRVMDSAGVLSAEQLEDLQSTADEKANRLSFDFTAVLVGELDAGADLEACADDVYDSCEFGYGPEYDGVLLLIDPVNRRYHISTCGYGIEVLNDAALEYMGQKIQPSLSEGNWTAAIKIFFSETELLLLSTRAGSPYQAPHEPLGMHWIFIALAGGFLIAAVVVGGMKAQLRSVRAQPSAANYVRKDSMQLTRSRDLFLYRNVTRTRKPQKSERSSSGSTTHTSASGTTHGGAGGSF